MIREEFMGGVVYTQSNIDAIYADHEARLKEVNRVKEDFRKVALDLDTEASELRAQLKEKDEEIKWLREENKYFTAELEALQQPKSCEGCKYGKYGADSRGIEVECTLIWHCSRGNGFPDRYEAKDQ